MRCPWPALRAARAMRGADRIIILADDPAAAAELDALASQAAWHCEPVADISGPCFLLKRQMP
ncbi:hypothetical protein BH10PSE12_BH10PSE12_15430 [soil metagenome]